MPGKRRLRASDVDLDAPATDGPDMDLDNDPADDEPLTNIGVYLSPDDRHLAVSNSDDLLMVYRLTGERRGKLLHERPIRSRTHVAWSKSGDLLAFVGKYGEANILSVAGTGMSVDLGQASALSFSPDDSRLAVLDDQSVRICTTGEWTTSKSVVLPDGRSPYGDMRENIAFSPDGRWIACDTDACTVQILDAVRLRVIAELTGHENTIEGLEWLRPDMLASASSDQTIRFWQVPEGRELRVLEVDGMVEGITYSPIHDILVGWTGHMCTAWSAATGEIRWREDLSTPIGTGVKYASASQRSGLLANLGSLAIDDIRFARGWENVASETAATVSTYANAKVLLLGDSGVGKSGLALVLAGESFYPTESTHARRIWRMPVGELDDDLGTQREVLLWDLAGQPGYRIVHQLHLSGGSVALILFDSRSETVPLAGIGYWARALEHAREAGGSPGDRMPTFLVAARTDRGTVAVSSERVAQVVEEFGFRAYLPTSALEGWGIADLRSAILAAIDWTQIPVVTSSLLFAAAKSFVLDQKAAGSLLIPLAALHATFLTAPVTGPAAEVAAKGQIGRDLLDMEPGSGQYDQRRLRHLFEGCVARLESAGLVKRLAFGDLILLQPELIDVYAGAIVNAAREEPDGLGSLPESRVLAVDLQVPQHERITDNQQEKLLIIATLEELTRHEIVLREETEEGVQLVFPSAFQRDLPNTVQPSNYSVEFSFEGPVGNIYATLVVRLARSKRFTRCGAWQSAVSFEADSGGQCVLHLVQADEGCGVLQAGYDQDVAEIVRFQFERFVMTHIERHAIPSTVRRTRMYVCPDCGIGFSGAQVDAARGRGRTSVLCPVDGTRVSLEDPFERLSRSQDPVTRQMDASADAARNIAAASSVVRGKEEITDYDVFLCHNAADKTAVRWAAERLREHGILPWLDEAELPPGRLWQEELERQINTIRSAAVFVGPNGIGPWQNQELLAFLREFADRSCPIIPVLLPGATAPALPLFLRGMTWVDLRTQDAKAIENLIWGITGRKPRD